MGLVYWLFDSFYGMFWDACWLDDMTRFIVMPDCDFGWLLVTGYGGFYLDFIGW